MLVLITYDVNTEDAAGRRRLRQIARQCVNYGQRVQCLSVCWTQPSVNCFRLNFYPLWTQRRIVCAFITWGNDMKTRQSISDANLPISRKNH